MPKPRIQSRVDQSQKDRVDDYADENDMTQAEAVRYLTFRGLDYEEGKLSASHEAEADPMAARDRELGASTGRWARNGALLAVAALALVAISDVAPLFEGAAWSVAGALASLASAVCFLQAAYTAGKRLRLLTATYDMTVAQAFRIVVAGNADATAEVGR